MTTSLQTFLLLAPEATLVAAALLVFLAGAFLGRAGQAAAWPLALVGLVVAASLAGRQPADGAAIASGTIAIDGFSSFIRWMVLVLGGLLALVQAGDRFRTAVSPVGNGIGDDRHRDGAADEAGTFLILLAGLSLAGVADDLVPLFIGLELVSIPTYILLALKRTDARGQEASLKYFFLSLVASALFLYSLVFFYGIGGSTSLAAIGARLRSVDPAVSGMVTAMLPVALGMGMAGAAFRLAAVPMHFYAPDVYEGTSPGNAALLSTLPKVAGIVVLVRMLTLGCVDAGAVAAHPFPPEAGSAATAYLSLFWQLSAALAAVTMTVGNVMALVQRNLRRMLACSSIAHAGYLLVGVAAAAASASAEADRSIPGVAATDTSWTAGLGGLSATLFYLTTYALGTTGVFAALTYLGHRWPEWHSGGGPQPPREEIETVDDLDGLSGTNPVAAFAVSVFLLSLAGIPPLPGFWGKLSLATTALEVDWNAAIASGSRRAAFVALAVILVLNAAIAAAYYLRIIAAMYFRTTKRGVQSDGGLSAGVAMLACLLLTLTVMLQPRGLFVAASRAGEEIAARDPSVAAGRLAGGRPDGASVP